VRVLGVREQRSIAWHVQFDQLSRGLPVQHRLRPLHAHRRLRRDRRDRLCPVPPPSALQQPVSFDERTKQVHRPSDRTTETYAGCVGTLLVYIKAVTAVDRETGHTGTDALRFPP